MQVVKRPLKEKTLLFVISPKNDLNRLSASLRMNSNKWVGETYLG